MSPTPREPEPDPDPRAGTPSARLSLAGWIAILVLLFLALWAGWYAVHVWNRLAGVPISPLGWLFMALGVLFTFLVGSGLMWLVFYSSRHHYDE